MKSRSKNKVVIVTGATKGIGRAVSVALAEKGFLVFGIARKLQPSPHKNIMFMRGDIRSSVSIRRVVKTILRKAGRIDALVNNVGVTHMGAVEATHIASIRGIFESNTFGPMRLIQEILPTMRKRGAGHILNVGSAQSLLPIPFGAVYCASKAALESMTESLAAELLPWKIKVSIVQPGPTLTHASPVLFSRFRSSNDPYRKQHRLLKEKLGAQKLGKALPFGAQSPQEVANLIVSVLEGKTRGRIRYQSSWLVEKMASLRVSDLSGKKLFHLNRRNLRNSGMLS